MTKCGQEHRFCLVSRGNLFRTRPSSQGGDLAGNTAIYLRFPATSHGVELPKRSSSPVSTIKARRGSILQLIAFALVLHHFFVVFVARVTSKGPVSSMVEDVLNTMKKTTKPFSKFENPHETHSDSKNTTDPAIPNNIIHFN